MTNPGQNTPWAGIPVPGTAAEPKIPEDLAVALDKVDTVLKNVVGGTTAPATALNPNVLSISTSQAGILTQLNGIEGRLNNSIDPAIETLQARMLNAETKANFLYNAPYVHNVYRTQQYTMWISQITDGEMVKATIPARTYDSVMHVWLNATWRWQASSITWPIKTKVKVKVEGGSQIDRIRAVQSGYIQTHQGHYCEFISAGKDVEIQITCCTYSGAPVANVNAELYESRAAAVCMFLPWNAGGFPLVPVGTPP